MYAAAVKELPRFRYFNRPATLTRQATGHTPNGDRSKTTPTPRFSLLPARGDANRLVRCRKYRLFSVSATGAAGFV